MKVRTKIIILKIKRDRSIGDKSIPRSTCYNIQICVFTEVNCIRVIETLSYILKFNRINYIKSILLRKKDPYLWCSLRITNFVIFF